MAVGSPVAASFMFVVESTIWCKNHGAKVFKCDSTLTQLFVTLEGFKSELERCFYGYNTLIQTSTESPNYAQDVQLASLKMQKVHGSQLLAMYIGTTTTAFLWHFTISATYVQYLTVTVLILGGYSCLSIIVNIR